MKFRKPYIFLATAAVLVLGVGAYGFVDHFPNWRDAMWEKITSSPLNGEEEKVETQSEDADPAVTYYEIKGDAVYYSGQRVAGADVQTFEELEDRWAKDKSHVYWEGIKQPYLDPATTKVFPYVYVVDKSKVWVYGTGRHMVVDETDADASSFTVVSHGYGKDSSHVYYFAKKIAEADVLSFVIFRNESLPSPEGRASNWYAKDKSNVYYRDSVIENADLQSFASLGKEYAKDKNKVYFEGKVIAGADPNSFVLVGQYAKDKSRVFSRDKALAIEIDPASFSVVDGGAIKDSKRVYFQDYYNDRYVLATAADAPTFQFVGGCQAVEMSGGSYFKDKNSIFVQEKPIPGVDVGTFQYLGIYPRLGGEVPSSAAYAKDKNAVYYACGEILKDSDILTFIDLKEGYAKDKSRVWYVGTPINGADAATFQSLEKGRAKDKFRTYFAGTIESAIYMNNKFGFQFSYPPDWRIGDNHIEGGTFQLFNYPESEANLSRFLKGQNKIEASLADKNPHELPLDPSIDSAIEKRELTYVQVGGRQATRADIQFVGGSKMRSYAVPLLNSSGRFLMIGIYGDPDNFGVIDTLVESIKWVQ